MDVLGRRDRSVFTACCRSRDEREQRHHACIASAQQCKGCPWTHQQSRASLRSRLALWKRHRQRATRFVSHAPLGRNSFATHSQAHRAVSEYIDQFFNPIRRHSTKRITHPNCVRTSLANTPAHGIVNLSTKCGQTQSPMLRALRGTALNA